MAVMLPFIYPLSKLQARQIVESENEENKKIDKELEDTRTLCAEQCHSNTSKCVEHSKEIRRLWRAYYTQPRLGSWASYRSEEYVNEMRRLFDSNASIKQIHARASQERRLHSKDALCTIRFNDDPLVKKYKNDARSMFDSGVPEQQIRDFILQRQIEVEARRTPRQQEYDLKLAYYEDEQPKLDFYRHAACTPQETDSPAMSKLRLKWQNLFEEGISYPEIYAAMKKDIDSRQRLERELREKDAELQRAKIAHDKAEFAKAEKKKANEGYARERMLKMYTLQCVGQDCQNLVIPISEEVGLLECGICYKLQEDGILNHSSYFCTDDCMDRTGRDHILKEHPCTAASSCTSGVFDRSINDFFGSICIDCWKHFKVVSYFCSIECLETNYRDHIHHSHSALRAELIQKLVENDDAWEDFKREYKVAEEDLNRAMAETSLAA